MSTERNASLDALRVLGVVGVVAIHASNARQSDPLALYFDELGRFAVPMFFVLSGYFWKPAELENPLALVGRVAIRVLPAFVLFAVLMTLVAYWRDPDFSLALSPLGIFRLLWTGGEAADYLWFLPALVVGTAVVASLSHLLGWRATYAICTIAYLAGCAIGAYGAFWLDGGLPFWWYRNGLLFAPLFLASGVYLSRHRDIVAHLPPLLLLLSALAFASLHVAEGQFVLGRTTMGHDFGLATAPYALAMTMLFMRLDVRGAVWVDLGRASFGAYLIHPLLLTLMVPAMTALPLAVLIMVCAALSLAIAASYRGMVAGVRPPREA